MKKIKTMSIITALSAVFLFSACTTPNQYSNNIYSKSDVMKIDRVIDATVLEVENVQIKSDGNLLVGLGGATVGGVLGNQVGKGNGRTIATAIGALAVGYAANEVYKNYGSLTNAQRILVKSDSGEQFSIVQTGRQVYVGERVKISFDNNGGAKFF